MKKYLGFLFVSFSIILVILFWIFGERPELPTSNINDINIVLPKK